MNAFQMSFERQLLRSLILAESALVRFNLRVYTPDVPQEIAVPSESLWTQGARFVPNLAVTAFDMVV